MSFRKALLENLCLFEEHIDPPGKFMSVRQTDGPSWKIHVCSRNKWTLLENYKKVAPGKKEQIFSKTVSVAASDKAAEQTVHSNLGLSGCFCNTNKQYHTQFNKLNT